MQFRELKEKIKETSFEELRDESDVYLEVVILKKELPKLAASLEKFFGQPLWPSKNKPSPKIEKTIADFGGIMPGQTLYFSADANQTIFAMLWPWQDGQHTTVKIAKK